MFLLLKFKPSLHFKCNCESFLREMVKPYRVVPYNAYINYLF